MATLNKAAAAVARELTGNGPPPKPILKGKRSLLAPIAPTL